MERKTLFCAIAGLMLATGALAQTIDNATFVEFPSEQRMQTTGGCQVSGMSRNGKYIIGSTYVAGGFVYDVERDTLLLTNASGVSDDGVAVAGLTLRNLKTGKTSSLEYPRGNYGFLMTTGISADGRVVTGTGGPSWYEIKPLCWVDGKFQQLPFPDTATVGTFKVNGCRAEGVSDDGSVIWGYFIANPNTNPLIVWERQEDGSYEYVDTWSDLYEPQFGYVYDYDREEYDFVRGPNPYVRMQPYAMSGDGKLILIRTQENWEGPNLPDAKIGIFHVDTRTMELAPWSKDDVVGQAGDFDSRGIANDGTVVGIAFMSTLSDAVPFIMFPGEHPRYLNDVFPQFDRLWYYEDNSYLGLPYLLTVISEDARYIAGYSTDVITYTQEGGSTDDFGFWGYVIDLKAENVTVPGEGEDPGDEPGEEPENPGGGEEDGIDDILADKDGSLQYFTLEGIKVVKPEKGQLYIVRNSSGKTAKIIY